MSCIFVSGKSWLAELAYWTWAVWLAIRARSTRHQGQLSCSISRHEKSARFDCLLGGSAIKTERANCVRKKEQSVKKSKNFKLDERSSSRSQHILRDATRWPVLWASWWANCYCWLPSNAGKWGINIVRSQQSTWRSMQVYRWQVSLLRRKSSFPFFLNWFMFSLKAGRSWIKSMSVNNILLLG